MRLKQIGQHTHVFDPIRKKWFLLSPEEWVRQHVINYLISEIRVPPSRISVEKQIKLNDLQKRYDIVVYDRRLEPYLVVECKAPYVALDQSVIDQALRYNLILKAELVMISNGLVDFVFDKNNTRTELAVLKKKA